MGHPRRIWAVSALHGDTDKLTRLHDDLFPLLQPGDRIVYHGNYTGYNQNSAACISELLAFRRMVLAMPGMIPSDLVYLRGAQEEIWQKILELPFAPDPTSIYLWMLGNGVKDTLISYGLDPVEGLESCRQGTMILHKWSAKIRQAVRARAGHETFGTQLTRAAYTAPERGNEYPMLFVHSGLDYTQTLEKQGDSLWWGSPDFEGMQERYQPFEKVVRGFDPAHKGKKMNCITATIDGGCGFGGTLVCAGFGPDGSVVELIEH